MRNHSIPTLVAALALFVLAALGPGCKSDAPHPLELTPVQTQVFGLDFSTLPDQGLVNQDGQPFTFDEVFSAPAKPAIVTEIYTNCPVPTMCPMLMSKVARAQSILKDKGVDLHDYHIIVMSLDPKRDTPKAMKAYAATHGLDLANAYLVTGNEATLNQIMKAIEVGIRQLPDGTFMHSMRTYIVGANGEITHGFRQSGWNPEFLAERLKSQIR